MFLHYSHSVLFYSGRRVCRDLVKPFRSVSILIEHLLNRRVSVFFTRSRYIHAEGFLLSCRSILFQLSMISLQIE